MKKMILLILTFMSINSFSTGLRNKLVLIAESQLGVKEATGKNDGPEVHKYLHSTGFDEGSSWCAAFIAWCHEELKIPNPKSPWSPHWFEWNVVYESSKKGIKHFKAKKGQVFGLYSEDRRRVTHIGLITGITRFNYETIEGNIDNGVYRRLRNKRSIYVIADYCKNED